MTKATLEHQLHNYFEKLPEHEQVRLVDFARTLAASQSGPKRTASAINHLFGSIPADDIVLMKDAIDNDCEQINPSSWH